MAKYFASPWGFLRGKLNDAVGGYWKGIEWTRVRVYPTQRGTLDLLKALEKGLIREERFSWQQFNIRRLVFQVLGWIGKEKLGDLMYPVWYRLVRMRKWKLTPINAFVKRNAARLFFSIPHRDKRYSDPDNKPNWNLMRVSEGYLAPTPAITSATYAPNTGILTINWDTTLIGNAKENDIAFPFAYVEPCVIEETWEPNGILYGDARPPVIITPDRFRNSGSTSITIATNLDPAKIHAYIFFRDYEGIIGYSTSVASSVT